MAFSPYTENFGPDNNQYWGSAAPSLSTDGSFKKGDVVWNNAPSASNPPGWVCTATGTPGTWKAMSNLAA